MLKPETIKDLNQRVEMGNLAKNYLASPEWLTLVKPMLDSMIKGLVDARDIDLSSDKKAAIEVKSRTLAADYIEKIQTFLEAYVTDGEVAMRLLTPPQEHDSLIRIHQP